MKSEADALQELSKASRELEKYKAVYGDHSTLPPDASKLADQLQKKEDEIRRLRLLDTQHGQVRRMILGILRTSC
jgi:E3 ubiquitin-protein ligase BRE1